MKRYLMSFIWGVAIVCLALSVGSPGFAQQDLIEGAKKEGEVVVWVHTMANPNQVIKPFEKKYPFLKVKFWDSRSATMIARMIEEAKAGSGRCPMQRPCSPRPTARPRATAAMTPPKAAALTPG